MRVKTLQVHWHEKQPIFSCDFEPIRGGKQRLATAGGDAAVRVSSLFLFLFLPFPPLGRILTWDVRYGASRRRKRKNCHNWSTLPRSNDTRRRSMSSGGTRRARSWPAAAMMATSTCGSQPMMHRTTTITTRLLLQHQPLHRSRRLLRPLAMTPMKAPKRHGRCSPSSGTTLFF